MYGQLMALNQVATVNAPEPRVLIVTPFDKGQIKVDREGDSRVRISDSSRRRRARSFACRCRR